MRKIFLIITFLKSFSVGVMMPVLALSLIAHGASINTISLLLGTYSLTALFAEFPSGIFADICGRKKSALLAYFLSAVSFVFLLFSNTLWLLFLSMVFTGLGRAFASGSMDALIIDDTVSKGITLVKVTSRLSIFESAGLAAGALAGGCLSGIIQRYTANILTGLIINVLLLMVLIFFVKEKHSDLENKPNKNKIGIQIKNSLSFLSQKGLVRILLVFTILTGTALFSVETYWQPAFSEISSASWLLGVTSFTGFAFVILGSKIAECFLAKKPNFSVLWLIINKLIFGILLSLFMLQNQIPLFIGMYVFIYFFVGNGNVTENTLLNQIVSPDQRASILSLFSFILQAGGIITALLGYIVSTQTNYRVIWLIAGILLILGVGLCVLLYRRAIIKSPA
ncbi:MAG TPA: MFS transporter [Oscillospiraceae bacterium]|nr:MFS transporter [Oscillospiraceae bacterium]HPF56755.1 MFS transporter [Clostridiales bacterium]HPK35299.1 MFS transporter [Oscillospiraceae bacterium]HPR76826.1 MFS transporter [Oscillospiraceae bacterium]